MIEVKKEFRNDLLRRSEFEFVMESYGNPGKEKVMSEVSAKTKAEPERITIKRIVSSFGKGNFVLEVFVYDSVGDMKKFEVNKVKKK